MLRAGGEATAIGAALTQALRIDPLLAPARYLFAYAT